MTVTLQITDRHVTPDKTLGRRAAAWRSDVNRQQDDYHARELRNDYRRGTAS